MHGLGHQTRVGDVGAVLAAEGRGAPFVRYRDSDGVQVITTLPSEDGAVWVVGRRPECQLALTWDTLVSRQHARLERFAGAWTIVDDGLARNGTFLNGTRIHGRCPLEDHDILLIGRTQLEFRVPPPSPQSVITDLGDDLVAPRALRTSQRKVLVELCRPVIDGRYAAPATNPEIAARLHLSVEAVRTHMRTLFTAFALPDLPQGQKRAQLVALALRSGTVSERDVRDAPRRAAPPPGRP